MKCFEAEPMLEGYLRGDLGEKETEGLEEHLLTCENCHEHLEDLTLLRASLESRKAASSEAQMSRRFQWRWVWLAAAAGLILAVVLWPRFSDPRVESDVRLAELALVSPVPYEPKSLRVSAGEGEGQFRQAMVSYQEGRFEEAIPGLESVVELDADLTKAQFYLGVSYLLADDASRAIDRLTQVVDSSDPAYREWALFYRGKAHLRLGGVESARLDLDEVARNEGELAPQAKEVLEKLQNRGE